MKKTKRLFTILIAIVMAFSLTGCKTTTTLSIELDCGDVLDISMRSSNSQKLNHNNNDNFFKIHDKDKLVFEWEFHTEESMASHVRLLYLSTPGIHKFEDMGETNGVKYVLFSTKVLNGTAYEMIGWIVGSNTGFIAYGYTSKAETLEYFKSLTFNIVRTNQANSNYYFNKFDDFQKFVKN